MRSNYTHFFHPYPAKFPAEIIRPYIERYTSEGESVIDPFCGSGTTLAECRLLGRNSLGIELNPIGALISRSKSANYKKKDIQKVSEILKQILNEATVHPKEWTNNNFSEDTLPNYENRDYWFQPKVIKELSAIKSKIIEPNRDNKVVYELLLTAFSRIIVPVSNQDTETRYARIEKDIKSGDILGWFTRTLKSYYETLSNTSLLKDKCKAKVIEGDVLRELSKVESDSYDFAITSPPYINSFDYYLYHKHRIFLLNKNPLLVRKTEIGGHHTIDSQSFEKAFDNYYAAVKEIFVNLHRILKPGKKFVLFIGDGIVKGKVINIADVMNKIADETEFRIIEKETSPLSEVSKGFIKDHKIRKKKHHVMTFINLK